MCHNTGIGEFSEVVLSDEQIQDFQKYLIYNHAAGIGDPAPLEYVRGAMLSRLNVLSKGHSAIRPVIPQHNMLEGLLPGHIERFH